MNSSRSAYRAELPVVLCPHPAVPAGSTSSITALRRRALWRFLAAALGFCAVSLAASAFAVELRWNPNPERDIVRYELAYGTRSGVHDRSIDAGNATQARVDGLAEGSTYYFVVRAVNAAGKKSQASKEIAWTLPATPLETQPLVPRSGWSLGSVDSEETEGYAATRAFDGDPATFWHTRWSGSATPPPHELRIDLGSLRALKGFRYLPRQDGYAVGTLRQYEFLTSTDGSTWTLAASGSFASGTSEKQVLFSERAARHIALRCLSDHAGSDHAAIAELNAIQGETPITPPNEAPLASDDDLITDQDQSVGFSLSASDPENAPLTYQIVTAPAHGTLSGTAPDLLYTPDAGFSGEDFLLFRVSDGTRVSENARITFTVVPVITEPVNHPPVFSDGTFRLDPGTELVAYPATSLAGSASDPDDDEVLTFSKRSGPAWLAVAADGSLSGTPPAGSRGENRFGIRVADAAGASADAELVLVVRPAAEPPPPPPPSTEGPLPWTVSTLGSPGGKPASAYKSKSFRFLSAGNLSDAADAGIFTWQTLTGDGEIVARIESFKNARSFGRAGLMIRSSLAPGARHVFAGVNGNGNFRWIRRLKTSGETLMEKCGPGETPATWVKLSRQGATLSAFKSSDGSTWTRMGSTTIELGPCYIGLFSCGGKGRSASIAFSEVKLK